ncbi:hypothetical protein [Mycolicibacterium brisbanense]|uniref:Uncharacterized protein n=1 Tax=Mycolicibacterium brisbanense TaxID=146020 RepID=A0A100VZR6_9MYCO|nr:hypothetical protein [Mycolicibacterium brisbanense]MCV7160517.1 hypothetical protein [Mycolicibacterium brisbanense]GAS88973.1 uncharacterized protein RMCB_3069 [Mycolicibacterium brisbanense]
MPENSRQAQSHREAVQRVRNARGFALTLPVVGRVAVPPPEQLAFYSALGVLAAIEIIDWPVALLLGAGQVLMRNEQRRIAAENDAA